MMFIRKKALISLLIVISLGILLSLSCICVAEDYPLQSTSDLYEIPQKRWVGHLTFNIKKLLNYNKTTDEYREYTNPTGAGGFLFNLYMQVTDDSGETKWELIDTFSKDNHARVEGNDETGEYQWELSHIDSIKLLRLTEQDKENCDEANPIVRHFKIVEDIKKNVTPESNEVYIDVKARRTKDGTQWVFETQYKRDEKIIPLASFYNKYKLSPVQKTIRIKKLISRSLLTEDSFTFQIRRRDGEKLRNSNGELCDKLELTLNEENHFQGDFVLLFTLEELLKKVKDESGRTVYQYYVNSKEIEYVIEEVFSGEEPIEKQSLTISIENRRENNQLEVKFKEPDPENPDKFNYNTDEMKDLRIRNEYSPDPISVPLKISKNLKSGSWPAEGFTFILQEIDKEPESITINDISNPSVIIKKVYEESGTYTYRVTEQKPGNTGGILYDDSVHSIIVKVEDKADGLKATVLYDNVQTEGLTITNEKIKDIQIQLKAKKVVENNIRIDPGEFTFRLEQTDSKGNSITDGSDPFRSSTGTDNIATFTLNLERGKTYYYKMMEEKGGLPGWTYAENTAQFQIDVASAETPTYTITYNGQNYTSDSSVPAVEFSNRYTLSNGEAEIKVEKILTGRLWNEEDEFTFCLTSEKGAPIRTANGMVDKLEITASMHDPDPAFPRLIYEMSDLINQGVIEDKTFEYTITEKEPETGTKGVVYDKHVETIQVKVKENRSTGKIETEILKEDKLFDKLPSFINRYTITDEKKVKVGVFKRIENRLWENGDSFEFQIFPYDAPVLDEEMPLEEMPMPSKANLYITYNSENVADQLNTKSGYFDEMTFTIPGIYTYEIREIEPEKKEKGMTYDKTRYYVEIKVEDNGDGTLKEPTIWYSSTESERPSVVVNTYNKDKDKDKDKDSYLFSFAKQWYGMPTDNVSFTLYNPDGTERKHSPVIIKESDKLWIIKYWLSSPGDYYAVENASNGYTPVYQNRGTHEEVQDRVYNGGRIINYQAPPTGDKNHLNALFIIAGICLTGILIYAGRKQNEK